MTLMVHFTDDAAHNGTQATVENNRGEWVPAIPVPLYVGFWMNSAQCKCGEQFHGFNRDGSTRKYREHYALVHILGLD